MQQKPCGYCNRTFSTWAELNDHRKAYHTTLRSAVDEARKSRIKMGNQMIDWSSKAKKRKGKHNKKSRKRNNMAGSDLFEPMSQKQKDEMNRILAANKKKEVVPKHERQRGLRAHPSRSPSRRNRRGVHADLKVAKVPKKKREADERVAKKGGWDHKEYDKIQEEYLKNSRNEYSKELGLEGVFDGDGNLIGGIGKSKNEEDELFSSDSSRKKRLYQGSRIAGKKKKQHGVRGHRRRLLSGGYTWVNAHERGGR